MTDLPLVSARLFNTPHLIAPRKAFAILAGLGDRFGVSQVALPPEGAVRGVVPLASLKPMAAINPTAVYPEARHGCQVEDGIALVAVHGTMVARGDYMDADSGLTGYNLVAANLTRAAADPAVRGIMLDVDTYGGEGNGCDACADLVRRVGEAKPVWARVADHAYSAGYWIASQAHRVVLTPTGGAGSIGVVILHADFSRNLDAAGITVTLIHAGQHKVDGNPYEPLPDAVRDELQAETEALRARFAERVAAARGLDVAAVLGTEARTYLADAAVALGLADAVMQPLDALAEFAAELGKPAASPAPAPAAAATEEDLMSNQPAPAPVPGAGAVAPAAAIPTTPAAAAPVAGASAADERARVSAILTSAEAEGRETLAKHFAFNTDMSADAARAALAAAPKAGGGDPYTAAMSRETPSAVAPGAAAPAATDARAGLRAAVESRVAQAARQRKEG